MLRNSKELYLFLRISMAIYATYAVHMIICFLKNKQIKDTNQHVKLELELFCGRYKVVTGSALAGILKSKGYSQNNLAISFLHGCLRKQNFGKSTVCLSVHLPLRLPPPAFESIGNCRLSGEGAEVSKLTESQQVSGKPGTKGRQRNLDHCPLHRKVRHNSAVPPASWPWLVTRHRTCRHELPPW